MAGTAELQAVLALQKKQLEQLAEQQQLFETLLANQTTTTETPPATSSSPVASTVASPVRTAGPEEKYVRVTFKVSRVTDIDDKGSTFTAVIKYTATWEPDHIDLQALRRHFAQAEAGLPSEPGVPTWNDWLKGERSPDPVATAQMPNKWNFDVIPGGEKLPAGVWEPRLWIRNEYDRHANYEEEWFSVLPTNDLKGGALMAYTRETHSTFYESFELERFPFDNQQLQFELVSMQEVRSAELLPKEAKKARRHFNVKLIKNLNGQFPSYCETNNFPLEQEFILSPRVMVWPEYRIDHDQQEHELSCWKWLGSKMTRRVRRTPPSVLRQASAPRRRDVRLTTRPSESPSRLRYPRMHVAIRVERKVFYWLINLVLPMYIMTACLGAVFFVPPGDMADRCSISLTILLTQVGFKYSIGDKLPSVSYITYIDMYMLLCFAVTFLVVIMQAIAAAGAYIEPMTIGELPPGPWWSSFVLEHGSWPFRTWPPIAAFYFFSWTGLHVVGLPLLSLFYRLRTSRDPENRMWRHDRRLVRALYVGPLDDLQGEGGLPEPRQDSKPFDQLREYIADAFEDLNAECSQISIFERSYFHPKARPKISSTFGVVLLHDREDEYEVADALNQYHNSSLKHLVRADRSTEKASKLRQLGVKVEPLNTAFTAIKKANGRVVNLLDEAKPLRRQGHKKVDTAGPPGPLEA